MNYEVKTVHKIFTFGDSIRYFIHPAFHSKMIIYHKPNCSTSLEALSILKKKKIKPEIIHYLETPPTKKELKELLKKLGMKAEDLVRKKESLYKEKFEGKKISEAKWLDILVKNPILIERPIIVEGDRAIIARPMELLNEFLRK